MSFLPRALRNDKSHATLDPVTSRHRDKAGVAVRTTPDIRDAANTALDHHGWTLAEYLIACLHAVADQPEQLLATLTPYRPPPKTRGRPRAG